MTPTPEGEAKSTMRELPARGYRTMSMRARVVTRAEDGDGAPDENAPLEIAISSEEPVARWFGLEILDHSPGAVDLTFGERGMAFLVAHDQHEASRLSIGIVRKMRVDKDRVLRGEVTFSDSGEAQQVRRDMLAGLRPYISVGYRVHEYVLERSDKEGETYRATKWTPGEASTVAVPADPSVGMGRSADEDVRPTSVRVAAGVAVEFNNHQQENRNMDPKTATSPERTEQERAAEAAERQKEIAAAVAKRSAELSEITQLCIAHGCAERAHEFLESGKTPGEVAIAILEAKRSAPLDQGTSERAPARFNVTTDASKRPEYSLRRAIERAVAVADGGARFDGYEAEVDQEIRTHLPTGYKSRGGILVPEGMGVSRGLGKSMARMVPGLAQTRAGLDSATSGAGAELVFDQPGDFIDLLRNLSSAMRLGVTMLTGLGAPLTFPKQIAAGTAYWVGENPGSDVSDADLDTGTIALAPKTLMSSTSHSRQLLAQASYDVEALIRRDLATIHALAIDKAVIHGSGSSNQPTGIYAASGVNSKAMGGVPDFGKLVDMATEVATDNALMGNLAFLATPGMAGKLMQTLVASSAGSAMIWSGNHVEGTVAGYRAVGSSQVSAVMSGSAATGGSSHGIVFGNWSDVLVGTWGALELIVDPYTKKKQAMVEITSYELADVLLRHGESFCKATGATIS